MGAAPVPVIIDLVVPPALVFGGEFPYDVVFPGEYRHLAYHAGVFRYVLVDEVLTILHGCFLKGGGV